MKKYMAYSFGTLWMLVLIVALVAAIIHQVNFQDSGTEIALVHKVQTLESKNLLLKSEKQKLGKTILVLEQEQLELLANPYFE